MMASAPIFQPEAAVWCVFCWLVLLARLISRRMRFGAWRRLLVEDYLAIIATVTATILMAVLDEIERNNSEAAVESRISPGYSPVKPIGGEQHTQGDRVYGAKLLVSAEQLQILTVWLMKAALLLMYSRLTTLLAQHKQVVYTAIYVASGFVFMEIFYFAVWCRPFSQYWAVIPHSEQCGTGRNHLVTSLVLNVSSDFLILAIPLPILYKVQLAKKKKAVIIALLLVGCFTIVAAIASKAQSFRHEYSISFATWYIREAFTALLCANLPLTYPLLQHVFNLKNWSRGPIFSMQIGSSQFRFSDSGSGIKYYDAVPDFMSTQKTWNGGVRRTVSSPALVNIGPPKNVEYRNARFGGEKVVCIEMRDVANLEARKRPCDS